MTKEEKERKNRAIENSYYDAEVRKFIMFMCKKGCKFYTKEGCSKKRIIRECSKKGLKNKE